MIQGVIFVSLTFLAILETLKCSTGNGALGVKLEQQRKLEKWTNEEKIQKREKEGIGIFVYVVRKKVRTISH